MTEKHRTNGHRFRELREVFAKWTEFGDHISFAVRASQVLPLPAMARVGGSIFRVNFGKTGARSKCTGGDFVVKCELGQEVIDSK
ncbi:MAG: hypothetical protein JWN45_2621 [Acidobacteriaceae bacterium]|nr:hypothetical protein [Acidobacteriaceae bacterium]